MPFIQTLGEQGAGQIASGIIDNSLGLITQGISNKQQLKQQRKLQNMALEGHYAQSQHDQKMAMKFWEDTNYAAQVEQLEKAGLSKGLMYGMKGGGGASTGPVSGSPGMAAAATFQPRGGAPGMGMQLPLIAAQVENIKADTELKKADAVKTAGVDTAEANTRIQNMLKDIEFKGLTMEDRVDQANTEAQIAIKKLDREDEALKLDRATRLQRAELVRAEVAGQWAANELARNQSTNTKEDTRLKQEQQLKIAQEITTMIQQVKQGWKNLSLHEAEVKIKAFEAQVKQQYPGFWNVIGGQLRNVTKGITDIMLGEDSEPNLKKN